MAGLADLFAPPEVDPRDFIGSQTAAHKQKQRDAMRQAAYLENLPNPSGQVLTNPEPSRPAAIGTILSRALEGLGMPSRLAADYGGYGETAAELSLPATLDVLDRGNPSEIANELAMAAVPGAKKVAAPGTWWHGVSDVKLQQPLENMQKLIRPSGESLDKKIILPEDFKVGDRLLMFPGDRTAAGKQLLGTGGRTYTTPVDLSGGGEFMWGPHQVANKAAWASHRPVMEGHAGRIRAGSEGGGNVWGGYVPMAHPASDFSQQTTNAVKQSIQAKLDAGDITQAQIDEFDAMVRGPMGKEGGSDYIGPSPEWPGILKASQEEIESHGPTRLKVAKFADSKKFGDLVDMGEVRHGVNSDELLHTTPYNFGFSFAKMDPEGRFVENPTLRHPDYNTQGIGEYAGGWDFMSPLDVTMRDWANATAEKKGMPLSEMHPSRLWRSAYMQNPTQNIDQEWIDTQMKLREAILRGGGQ